MELQTDRIKSRASNMELLRVVAMFMVLMVHADFLALGAPDANLVHQEPLFAFGQYFFEALSIGCVDLFVLLSGWFGIKPKWSGFCNFIFQCLFFSAGILGVMLLLGKVEMVSLKDWAKGVAGIFSMIGGEWFTKSYIGLYLLAPLLNLYVEKVDRITLRNFLIAFYVFQTLYAWLSNGAVFFLRGYSTMSFIGLYLLARYVRLYPMKWTSWSGKADLLVYVGLSLVLTLTVFAWEYVGVASFTARMYSYVSPLVIVAVLYLLLAFSKWRIGHHAWINWLGVSSFAVYLLHTNMYLLEPFFLSTVRHLFSRFEGISSLLVVFAFLLTVFAVSVLLDQPRKYLWKTYVSKIVERWTRSC